MADLVEKDSSQVVKITGSNAAGDESNYVNSTANGELLIADISNNGGTQGAITVGTSAVEAKVGSTALSNRKNLTIYNNSGNTIYWGYTSAVTTSTGSLLLRDSIAIFDVGPNTSVFLIGSNTGNNVRITESA